MHEFPEQLEFNIGEYIDLLIQWLVINFEGFFNGVSASILWVLVRMDSFFLWLPWWAFILAVFLITWRLIKWTTGLLFVLLLMMVGMFGYWDLLMSTLAIVLASVLISLAIGVPIGIMMALNSRIETIVKPILDAMQTMPSFVYLIPAMMLFSLGKVPAVFATIIYAVSPVIRLTNLAIRRVSREMVEASISFGSTPWQMLTKVQLPQALPTIMTGINQTTMMALAMVVIASMVGASGLGMEVLVAINRMDIARGFEAGVSIVILAVIIDRITQAIGQRFKVPE
jgi:glycine betaine/proline transport system permease protein